VKKIELVCSQSLALLQCHPLSATNIGIKVGMVVNLNLCLGVFLFTNILKCNVMCKIL
jgi:hypothetical protein